MMDGMMDGMIEMRVSQLTIDPLSELPILILSDVEGRHLVPIWIGAAEAAAIAAELGQVTHARPMTHDLMAALLRATAAELHRVEVHDVQNGTYFASIVLGTGGKIQRVDARPSDAVALAIRLGTPIWVARKVLGETCELGPTARPQRSLTPAVERLAQVAPHVEPLEAIAEEDFGKWKM